MRRCSPRRSRADGTRPIRRMGRSVWGRAHAGHFWSPRAGLLVFHASSKDESGRRPCARPRPRQYHTSTVPKTLLSLDSQRHARAVRSDPQLRCEPGTAPPSGTEGVDKRAARLMAADQGADRAHAPALKSQLVTATRALQRHPRQPGVAEAASSLAHSVSDRRRPHVSRLICRRRRPTRRVLPAARRPEALTRGDAACAIPHAVRSIPGRALPRPGRQSAMLKLHESTPMDIAYEQHYAHMERPKGSIARGGHGKTASALPM
jgi:hypothetical protein